jgi:hypothetical protein
MHNYGRLRSSVNDVTSERHLDTLSGNVVFNGLAVTLEAGVNVRSASR